MADLITLAEYRTFVGTDPTDTRDDNKISARIPAVTQAIRSFTERDFGSGNVTETRTYEYDGSGYLDIDDASAISQVTIPYDTGDVILDADEWIPKPERRDDAPVYNYLLLPAYVGAGLGSPEMGFTRNFDVYYRERRFRPLTAKIEVTATWGWPVIPEDVKVAAYWTLRDWMERDSGEGLASEAIEGYARSWARAGGEVTNVLAIPSRARDILVNYAKVAV